MMNIASTSASTATRPAGAASRGFGLVELMVSIVIGLVIIAALVALFVGTSRNNREMATANSMIENGRFAIQLLEGDVVHAGFWGTLRAAVRRRDGATACRPTCRPAFPIPASSTARPTGMPPT